MLIVVYVLIGAGIALTLLRVAPVFFLRINLQLFNLQVLKLLAANNSDRAIKLCNAVPRVPYAMAIKLMLERAKAMGEAIHGSGARQLLGSGFADDLAAEIMKLRSADWLASSGVLLAVTGAALSLTVADAPPFTLVGPLIALGFAYSARRIINTQFNQARLAGPNVIEAYLETADKQRQG